MGVYCKLKNGKWKMENGEWKTMDFSLMIVLLYGVQYVREL